MQMVPDTTELDDDARGRKIERGDLAQKAESSHCKDADEDRG